MSHARCTYSRQTGRQADRNSVVVVMVVVRVFCGDGGIFGGEGNKVGTHVSVTSYGCTFGLKVGELVHYKNESPRTDNRFLQLMI